MFLRARELLVYCLLLNIITRTAAKFFLVEIADNQLVHKKNELKDDGDNYDVWRYIHEHGVDYAASTTDLADGTRNTSTHYQQERLVSGTDYKYKFSDLEWEDSFIPKENEKKKTKKQKEKKKKRKIKKKNKRNPKRKRKKERKKRKKD